MNKKKLILIAEDDVSIRTILSTELENKYELKLTDNCAQLWNWVSDGLGDLIILDVVMPDENGLDLILRIKQVRPNLPVVVMSAKATFLTAIEANKRGAYEYLPKPFDLDELISVVEKAISEPQPKKRGRKRTKKQWVSCPQKTIKGNCDANYRCIY